RILVAARHDLERLQQRHARLEHRGELPREERDVLLIDSAAAAKGLALELGDADALPPQVGGDDGFGGTFGLSAHLTVVAVYAFPEIGVFLDPGVSALRNRCGHGSLD